MKSNVLAVATQGIDSNDGHRLRVLLAAVDAQVTLFEAPRTPKLRFAISLLAKIVSHRPDLVVLEGTGLAGGVPLIVARLLIGQRYVVSSGDAVGPFFASKRRVLAPIGWVYELALMRCCTAFLGWTPYLVGRALTLGARRAATIPGWAPHRFDPSDRAETRRALDIADSTIVFGIVGSLAWNSRVGYCYGLELVRALSRTTRTDVAVVVVGDGDGLAQLREAAGDDLHLRVKLVGRVDRDQIPRFLAAFDVASLPQSCDQVGSFRYSTKLAEYVDADLPIVTGEIPASYDLVGQSGWRLPGESPWAEEYVSALSDLMTCISKSEFASRAGWSPSARDTFDFDRQKDRALAIIEDCLS